jgi:preprotein translocase subunit SecG
MLLSSLTRQLSNHFRLPSSASSKLLNKIGGVRVLKMFFQILLLVVSLAVIVIVIAQPSKGEGLGAIGSGGQMFFAKNKGLEKLLDKATMWLSIIFGLLLILVDIYGR